MEKSFFTLPTDGEVFVTEVLNADSFNKLDGIAKQVDDKIKGQYQQALLDLLAYFDDYSHPLQMSSEYVREQITKFMEEIKDEK